MAMTGWPSWRFRPSASFSGTAAPARSTPSARHFVGHHPLAVDNLHVLGVLSLIFWSMMLVVTIKYVTIITRADNKGEGGSLALLALISSKLGEKRWSMPIVLLGVFATALFYGDRKSVV